MGARGRAGLLRGLASLSASLADVEEQRRKRLSDALLKAESQRQDEELRISGRDQVLRERGLDAQLARLEEDRLGRKSYADALLGLPGATEEVDLGPMGIRTSTKRVPIEGEKRQMPTAKTKALMAAILADKTPGGPSEIMAMLKPEKEQVKLEDQRMADALGIPLSDWLKRSGKLDKPVSQGEGTMLERLFTDEELRDMIRKEKERAAQTTEAAPKPSARGLVAGLETPLRGRFDTAMSSLTEPTTADSLGVLGSLTKTEKAPRLTKFESAENEIFSAAQTTRALGSGEFDIELTDEGVRVAADLMSADANVRERAAKRLRSADKIARLVRIAGD